MDNLISSTTWLAATPIFDDSCAERECWVETFARYIRAISKALISRDVQTRTFARMLGSNIGRRLALVIHHAFSLMDDKALLSRDVQTRRIKQGIFVDNVDVDSTSENR